MWLGGPMLSALIIGVAAGLIGTAAGAQQPPSSSNDEPEVRAAKSSGCAEQRCALAHRAADGAGEEQFPAALPGAHGPRQQFIRADVDGDGRISRDEWLRWFGSRHAGTAAIGDPGGRASQP
jgi:hypothetical protein